MRREASGVKRERLVDNDAVAGLPVDGFWTE